mmetsp:Transcript_11158/g.22226  ORF Transcript_11158/g.22226 Transcript_11158/m.22226 type:complete len:102 (-) Transcript_11158:529-834(-)
MVLCGVVGALRNRLRIDRELAVELVLPIVLFVVFILFNAQAPRPMSLPILTVFKSLAPLGITLVERFVVGDAVPEEVYLSMLPIVITSAVTFLHDAEFSTQ